MNRQPQTDEKSHPEALTALSRALTSHGLAKEGDEFYLPPKSAEAITPLATDKPVAEQGIEVVGAPIAANSEVPVIQSEVADQPSSAVPAVAQTEPGSAQAAYKAFRQQTAADLTQNQTPSGPAGNNAA